MTSINHTNILCLVTLRFPSSTSCHCPDHVPPRELDKKFDKILNLKITSNNNPANILTNLCTGLEKFLGFDKDSKGYDGSGIVYSDLDRLCDGVMGFLSGVLGAVKNENEVTTYDTNKELNDILSNLQNSIGKGSSVFSSQITQVSQWLDRYEMYLGRKTGAVTSELSELKDNKIGDEFMKRVAGKGHEKLQKQLEDWTTVVGEIETQLNTIEKDKVNVLNKSLREQIKREMKDVRNALWLLKESAGKEDFKRQVKVVDGDLETQKTNVGSAINVSCDALQDTLHTVFSKVVVEIENLRAKKDEHFASLKYYLDTTYHEVQQLFGKFDEEYKIKISGNLYDIKTEIEKYVKYDSSAFLQTQFTIVKDNVASFATKVKSNLKSLRDDIKNAIKVHVKNVQEPFDRIKKEIGNDNNGAKTGMFEFMSELKREIIDLVDGLTNADANPVAGSALGKPTRKPIGTMQQIADNIKKWAETFSGTEEFGKRVKGWIENILKEDEYVKLKIKHYVQTVKGESGYNDYFDTTFIKTDSGEIEGAKITNIADVIKSQLGTDIDNAGKLVKRMIDPEDDERKGKIQHHMTAVEEGIRIFVSGLEAIYKKQVGGVTTSTAMYTLSDTIAGEITKKVKSKLNNKPPIHEHVLQAAVQAILHRLVGRASQAASDLDWLIGDRENQIKIGNVEEAIRKINDISDKLTTTPGNEITKALSFVKQEIDKLDAALNNGMTVNLQMISHESL
ncbi:hypothetical protein, conserved, partial [Babesia bigemina]